MVSKIRLLKKLAPDFDCNAQFQAFRSWIFAKCMLVWPTPQPKVHNANFLALVDFWMPVVHLSLRELLVPSRWPQQLPELEISIASVLDVLIRSVPAPVAPLPAPTAVDPDDIDDPTPWLDCPTVDLPAPVYGASATCCQVVLPFADDVVAFTVGAGCALSDFVSAQSKLGVPLKDCSFALVDGPAIGLDHPLEIGQVVVAHKLEK